MHKQGLALFGRDRGQERLPEIRREGLPGSWWIGAQSPKKRLLAR
jgi:hypothetical protein